MGRWRFQRETPILSQEYTKEDTNNKCHEKNAFTLKKSVYGFCVRVCVFGSLFIDLRSVTIMPVLVAVPTGHHIVTGMSKTTEMQTTNVEEKTKIHGEFTSFKQR